jgi:hypothetical protein
MRITQYGKTRLKKKELGSRGTLLPRATPIAYVVGTAATDRAADTSPIIGAVGTIMLKNSTQSDTHDIPKLP